MTDNAAPRWQAVGVELGFTHSDLCVIETMPLLIPEGAPGYYREMIAQWMEWATPNHPLPTVESLVSALKKVGEERLALEFEKKMKPEKGQSTTIVASSVGDTPTPQSSRSEMPVYGCGCGRCTFVVFIETGCSEPSLTKTGLPFLDASKLSETEKEYLIGQLSDKTEKLMFVFQRIVSSTCASLENQGTTPANVAMSLLSLGALSSVFAISGEPLFHQRSKELRDARTIKDVFFVIHGYFSFFHNNVLEHLISEFGTPEDTARLESYKATLDEYCRHQVFECPPQYDHSCIHLHTSVVVKLDESLETFTLKQLKRFWSRFTKHFRLTEFALRLVSVEDDCMRLLFQIPSFVTRFVFPLLGEQEAALEEEKVIELVCGDYKFSSKTRAPPTATPTAPLALPPPLEDGQPDTQEDFDIVSALLGTGVPHIPDQIFSYFDGQCLTRAEAVSTLWRAVVGEGSLWKNLVKETVKSNGVWRDLFERRGWNKYLHVPLSQQTSSQFYRHLHQSASRDIHSLETNWRRGHYTLTKIETGSPVYCLQYDDDKIVTGHRDRTIKILDRSTLQVSKVLKGHKNWVFCLQYDEEMVISGSYDHTVKVWDIQTGQMVNELLHHKDTVWSLKFMAETLITCSNDKTVVFNIKSPTDITLRTVLKGHGQGVWAVELNETNIVSGGGDRTIKVWDSLSGGLVMSLHGHSDAVMSLQLRGSHLISGSHDKTIRIWNIDSGDCIGVLRGHDSYVLCVAVDDNRIISGSRDETVKVWDLAAALDSGSSSDALITTLKEHTAKVRAVSFDAFQLISGSDDGSVLIYEFLQLDSVTSSYNNALFN